MTASEVYDCYKFRGICKASMSNTTRGLVHSVTKSVPSPNAKITVDYRRNVVKLECTKIGAHCEVMTPYGGAYYLTK